MKKSQIDDVLNPADEAGQKEQERDVRQNFFAAMRRAARRIPFMEDVVAAYYCALDPQTPMRARGIMLAALAYFIMPFDLVPDLLLVIGLGDDIAVLMAAITAISTNIRPEHYEAARHALEDDELPGTDTA